MKINSVLIIGGTGNLGRPVVEQLSKDGFKVTVGSRSAESVQRTFGSRFETRTINYSNIDVLAETLGTYDAIHLNLPSGPSFEASFENEYRAAKNIAAAIKGTNVKRISYISGATVTADTDFPPGRAKWLAEEAVRGSGIPYTIWRATWFMEALFRLVRFIFIAQVGHGRMSVHWLAAEDYARMVSRSFMTEETAHKILYPFGPELISFKDAIRIFQSICHPLMPVIKIPTGTSIKIASAIKNNEMWYGSQLMKHFEELPELGDPQETIELTGQATTTLEQFCKKVRTA